MDGHGDADAAGLSARAFGLSSRLLSESRAVLTRPSITVMLQGGMEVVFFMHHWLAWGKDLRACMAEVLEGLGLTLNRIRILVGPSRLGHLLIPAQCWAGFDFDQRAWNAHLGCGCHQLMRAHRGSYAFPAATVGEGRPTGEKLWISRSELPFQLGRLFDDVVLDQAMEADGYGIFHPERHPIAEQIRL